MRWSSARLGGNVRSLATPSIVCPPGLNHGRARWHKVSRRPFYPPPSMPELPEVETVMMTLTPRVVRRRIRRVVHVRHDMVTAPAGFNLAKQLAGRTITGVARRGKR